MLKKKNIAMVMAASTVATSVAPVFAAVETQNVDEATLIAQVEEMLAKKYSNEEETGITGDSIGTNEEYKNSVYDITSTVPVTTSGGVTYKVDSVKTLKTMIEQAKLSDNVIALTIVDKGHKEVDGKIVASETTKNRFYDNDFATRLADLGKVRASMTDNGNYATITLANGKEIEIANGDYVLDMSKPVDANGNLIVVPSTGNLDESTAKRVVGFELLEDTKLKQDIPSKQVSVLNFDTKAVFTMEKNSSDILTEDGYTEEGAKFINAIRDAKSSTNTVVKDGVKYNVTNAVVGAVTTVKDGGYQVEITLKASKTTETAPNHENVKITILGESQKDLTTIVDAINGANDVVDVEGKVGKLAGDDRFETAVEVSKETYLGKSDKEEEGKTTAASIILVGEEAIVDGLAAAPLASAADAPILLTKKDVVPTSTMNEIKRLVEKGTKIYLVGGENNISKEVEKQLVSEMNAEIVRLAGDDRNETSLKIAEELKVVKGGEFTKHYVVGGDGLSDAMSIAAIAAREEAPILVTPAAGLTKDAKEFLEGNSNADVTIIGGESKISTQVLKDVKSKISGDVNRIAGEDRHETNAKVIATLTDEVDNVYVAKSGYVPQNGDALLVDALAAAPLAAKADGVIVLATDDVTTDQQAAVKKAVTKGANNKLEAKLTQVGGGVNANIIQKLVKLLGL
ncbi:cell wall-binding repeat-containing protein [Romboutsia timonensis]|uniref:cell wall-binding repeat-containing protein n=1 Tax=Romboutsia timonensis TaxID=1776391 RepID=UPI002A803A17|nr:cell wall-binding repeat-containing protein [Romboutsia timonensis]MDY3957997.1 cell wall-binding repeat-containing protein [Romboutsia timonensis]